MIKRIFTVLLVVLVALIFVREGQGAFANSAEESVFHAKKEYFVQKEQALELDLPSKVNMVVFEIKGGEISDFLVRVNNDDSLRLSEDRENSAPSDHKFSVPIFEVSIDNLVVQAGSDKEFVLHTYIIPEHHNYVAAAGLSGGAVSRIISRSSWGADENLRIYRPQEDVGLIEETEENGSAGKRTNICAPIESAFSGEFRQLSTVVDTYNNEDLIWPIRYSRDLQKIVVHHTASATRDMNDDGRVNAQDYAMQIRGIYNFHTLTKGWGDIGYNFIIDPQGNVYEGRAGRENGKMSVGAHVLCQNTGTVGIALLGNYNDQRVSVVQRKSLSKLIADISREYRLDPFKKSNFRGEFSSNIIGHDEIGAITRKFIGRGATSCPGSHLNASLSQVVAGVRDYMVRDYDIVFDNLPEVLNIVPGDKSFNWDLRFRNNGTKDLKSTVVKLSNGLEAVVGDLKAGETGSATFVFRGGMNAYSKKINARVYVKNERGFKRVGRTSLFELRRDKGYVRVTGNPTIISQGEKFYLGGESRAVLRYPISTNANLSAGFFEVTPANARAKRYIQRGVSKQDIRPADKQVDISVVFDISPDMRASRKTAVRVSFRADGFKIKGAVRGIVLDTVKIDVGKPAINKKTFTLNNRTEKFAYNTGDSVVIDFEVATTGISSDVLQSLTDGDLSLKLTSSNKRLNFDDEVLPLALSSDGRTLVASTSVESRRPILGTIEAGLYFGSQRLRDFSGRRGGFVKRVQIKRDRDSILAARKRSRASLTE